MQEPRIEAYSYTNPFLRPRLLFVVVLASGGDCDFRGDDSIASVNDKVSPFDEWRSYPALCFAEYDIDPVSAVYWRPVSWVGFAY